MGSADDTDPKSEMFRLDGPELGRFARGLGAAIVPEMPEDAARIMVIRELHAWMTRHTSAKSESAAAEAFAGLSAIAAVISLPFALMLPDPVRSLATAAFFMFAIVWLIAQTRFFVRRVQFRSRSQRALAAAIQAALNARPRASTVPGSTPQVAQLPGSTIKPVAAAGSTQRQSSGFDVDESIARVRALKRQAEFNQLAELHGPGPAAWMLAQRDLRQAQLDQEVRMGRTARLAEADNRPPHEQARQEPHEQARQEEQAETQRRQAAAALRREQLRVAAVEEAGRQQHAAAVERAGREQQVAEEARRRKEAEEKRVMRRRRALVTEALMAAEKAVEMAMPAAIERMGLEVNDPTATDEAPPTQVRDTWRRVERRELSDLEVLWRGFLPEDLSDAELARADSEWRLLTRGFVEMSAVARGEAEERDRSVRWLNRPAPAPDPQPYGVSHEGAEHLVAAWMRHLGVRDARVTAFTRDGGIDVESNRFVAQVKNYVGSVSVKEVRELHGVAMAEGKYALLFTSGSVTEEGRAFAQRVGVALISYDAKGGTLKGLNGLGARATERSIPVAFAAQADSDGGS